MNDTRQSLLLRAQDLSQDVLLSVVKHLPTVQHSGRRGAFRSWLRTIGCSRTADYWRAADRAVDLSCGNGATTALQQLTDPDSDLNRQWDVERDRYVLNCLLVESVAFREGSKRNGGMCGGSD
jgi:RNA polymerase sigma-70 factor, ECF subfamily